MTGYNKVFLDTAPIIYFLDNDVNFGEKAKNIFEEILENKKRIVTSVITCTEYLTFPYKNNNFEKVEAFFEFVSDCDIPLYSVDVEIAKKASIIRAQYKEFKTMDALQLASASIQGCDLFLTNDKQLKQFREIRCITVEEWSLKNPIFVV